MNIPISLKLFLISFMHFSNFDSILCDRVHYDAGVYAVEAIGWGEVLTRGVSDNVLLAWGGGAGVEVVFDAAELVAERVGYF